MRRTLHLRAIQSKMDRIIHNVIPVAVIPVIFIPVAVIPVIVIPVAVIPVIVIPVVVTPVVASIMLFYGEIDPYT